MNNNNALLIIDMQCENGFALEGFDTVVRNTSSLLSAARQQAVAVFYSRHINLADGTGLPPNEPLASDGGPASYRSGTTAVEILPALAPIAGETVIDKPRYSAFFQTDLHARLQQQGIDTLTVSGVLTDVCVMTTVYDAFALGYRIRLVTDACTATTAAAHYSALLILANWVYSLELVTTAQWLRSMAGEPYTGCTPTSPDQFAHQVHELPGAIDRLHTRLHAQAQE
ncbi:cysteine hydrolase family protein [Pseudomonas sp. R5(2019)]|uniref:cysteine hydrolase family protein n=1 Tax=Pseudomonas sp. R5(2019) TaxID=2697566 RepID=UPI0014127C0A|nr:isochorismatase family cysteine hydrolase [Pseudomonas sp. R5(2019)]NBA96280.1 isochorismatase family protein [Pseudomonas sp. R5(2019)]